MCIIVGRGRVRQPRTSPLHRQGSGAPAARWHERVVPEPRGAGVAHQGASLQRLGRHLQHARPQCAPAEAGQGAQGDQGGNRPR